MPPSSLDSFSRTLLDLSLAGTLLLRPVYDTDQQTIADFSYDYVNPAAQYMLRLAAEPTHTMLQGRPHLLETGVFAFYCEAFESGRASYYGVDFAYDGLDSYYQLAAQRQNEQLLVSFTDTADRNRGSIEVALRESQARERQARAAAETQRRELVRVFEQAPVAIAVYRGPTYIIELANPTVCRLWGRTAEQILGLGLFEALPEVAGMGYEELLDGVMASGQLYVAHEMPAVHERDGRRDTVYWDFVYLPMYEEDGSVYGAMVVATEVTEQVTARHQVEQLNQELESRVAARTQELRDQQRLLGQVLRQVPASIAAFTGPEHRYTFFNEPYQRLSAGRTQLDFTVAEVFPEVVSQGFVGLLDQVYATGQPFIGTDAPARLLDSATGRPEQRYVDFIYQALTSDEGQTEGVLAFIVDVTDKVLARQQAETLQAAMLKVAQRRAREREDLYQVFEQTPAAIMLLRGPEHRVEYFNPAYAQFFPGQELRGRLLADAHPRAGATGVLARLERVYQTGEPYYGHEQLVSLKSADGQDVDRYFNFTYDVYREQEQIAGISIVALDVTEQVLGRQQREAQQQELQRLFEQAPVAIAILRGPQLVIELANASAAAIWGRPAAQLLGHPYFEALPDMVGQGFEEILGQVLASGESFAFPELPVQITPQVGAATRHAYFSLSFQPLYDEQPHPVGVIVMGAEVTQQVLARQQVQTLNENLAATNEELHDSNTRLLHTNADLDNFIYTASHDLKAPISNIEGLVYALRQDLPAALVGAAPIARLLGLIDHSVQRFQQTLGHLTTLTRLQQAGAGPVETIDLAALVEDVRLDLAPALEAAGAQLVVAVADCPTVRFAPKNLRSIVFNLLSNAVKYRDPARVPHVELRATCVGARVELVVQDNGLGLSEMQQTKLFGLFRRLHTHVEGSGVGLYAVKKIVENAGGTIRVASELGVGSTFTIDLPR